LIYNVFDEFCVSDNDQIFDLFYFFVLCIVDEVASSVSVLKESGFLFRELVKGIAIKGCNFFGR